MSTEKPLNVKVKEWLLGSGFSFEMEVAQAFRAAGFRVSQADYYEDPTSKVQREIDVVVSKWMTFQGGEVQLSFAIECKTSREKPWVLFVAREGRVSEEAWQLRVRRGCGNVRGNRLRRFLALAENATPPRYFAHEGISAYGVVQALGHKTDRDEGGGDPSYAAVMQACKATVSLNREVAGNDVRAQMQNADAKVGFPVVVTNGRLFTAFLAADGSGLKVVEVDSYPLILTNPDTGTDWAYIWIVTRGALPGFASIAAELEKWIQSVCVANPAGLAKALDEGR